MDTTQTTTIRRATPADATLVADILAEAFFDDPFLSWLFPDERRRHKLAHRYFLTVTRALYLPRGEVFLNGDFGTLLTLPPGVAADALPTLTFLEIVWRMLWAHGFAGVNRARIANDVLKANHPRETHYYLHALGVRKSHQGQGVGSALLREATARCDREGWLAYLENSNARNAPLYERHGFRTVGEWSTPTGAKIWFMPRRPETK